jgi:hypothetical protein
MFLPLLLLLLEALQLRSEAGIAEHVGAGDGGSASCLCLSVSFRFVLVLPLFVRGLIFSSFSIGLSI